jgi:rhamnogalacturonyl hydrolase YesR
MLYSLNVNAQVQSKSETVLRSVADAELQDAKFHFIDSKSGQHFTFTETAPSNAQLRPESPYTDWRYWNGVLNIAMIKLGEVLQEPAYIVLLENITFSFDNYLNFKRKYNGKDKWNYPFGQCFIIEELDDCGSMGASIIEVWKGDPQDQYRRYVDRAANHILTKQTCLEDGTFVRSFPFKWTLWADDLYMGLSFLSRMGELTSDNRYFDDAVRQVIKFHQYLFNNEKGLIHHSWHSDLNRPSVAFWGRANGWVYWRMLICSTDFPKIFQNIILFYLYSNDTYLESPNTRVMKDCGISYLIKSIRTWRHLVHLGLLIR